MSGGHTGGYIAGNSLLIVGCKTSLTINVADKSSKEDGAPSKTTYDLDAGERTVTYEINPAIKTVGENRFAEGTDNTANITITANLPKSLHYVMNSASAAPESIIQNEDGTSKIVWNVKNQTIDEAMDKITFSCTIGNVGSKDDVQNNDSIQISANITADKDSRVIKYSNQNISDTTIHVIRLAATSVAKTVDKAMAESGEDITYSLRFGSSTDGDVQDARICDVLPYNGDGRKTKYSGDYHIKSIVIDFSEAQDTYSRVKDTIKLYYTSNNHSYSSYGTYCNIWDHDYKVTY